MNLDINDINTQNQMKLKGDLPPRRAVSHLVDHYLVDTENVGRDWVKLLDERENAVYHIFYTEKSPAIPIEDIELILEKQEYMKFIKCYTGTNALDFQLGSWLGYMLATVPEDHYHIVSKDTGYDAVVKFWADRGMQIDRSGQTVANITVTTEETRDIELLCCEAVAGLATAGEAKKIVEIIRSVTENRLPNYKTIFHTKLVKEFSQRRGSTLYNACKSIIEQAYLNPELYRSAS